MKTYIVQEEFGLTFGSTTRNPGGTSYRMQPVGTLLRLDSEAPNGNVWFFDATGERGKIECGEISNLLRDGRITEVATNAQK